MTGKETKMKHKIGSSFELHPFSCSNGTLYSCSVRQHEKNSQTIFKNRRVYTERVTALKILHLNTKCQHHFYFFLPSQNHFHNHMFILLIREEILRRAYDSSKIKYAQYRDYSNQLTISGCFRALPLLLG